MSQDTFSVRLPLVDNISQIFDKVPPINLFRAAANAKTLYPAFIQFMYLLFKPMKLDARVARLVVLYVAKLSDCMYIWRQNLVWREALGITQEQIDAIDRGETQAACFSDEQKIALKFAEEALRLIEVSDEVYTEAERFFGPQGITELLYVVGTYMLLARIARTGRVPLDERPAGSTTIK